MRITNKKLDYNLWYENKIVNGIMLIFLFSLFSLSYVRGVIGAQFGWWQYYGWRWLEGDILYKDIYLFMPPYFVFLTGLLFKLFGNHFIYYTIFVGYPIKIICLLLIYKIVCKFAKPTYAMISVFIGAVISASYLMDQWYDYNPIIMLPTLLIAFLIMKIYEQYNNVKKYFYLGLSGILISLLFGFKQTFGLTIGVTFLVMLIVISIKNRNYKMYKELIVTIIGMILGLMPLFYYIIKNDCVKDFVACVFGITGAKGGAQSIIERPLVIMGNIQIWIISALLIAFWCVLKLQKDQIKNYNLIGCYSLLLVCCSAAFTYIFSDYLKDSIKSIKSDDIGIFFAKVLVVFGIVFFITIKLIPYRSLPVAFLLFFSISMILWMNLPSEIHQKVYEYFSVLSVRRIFMEILVYVSFVKWLFLLWGYFRNQNTKIQNEILMVTTIICAHFFTGILSANSLEEIYMILYIPWIVAYILEAPIFGGKIKNYIIIILIFAETIFTISAKIYIPFDWQGWREPQITKNNINSTVNGLNLISVPQKVDKELQDVVDIIDEYSDKDDYVFQFGNLMLFNIITMREVPTYACITWFDVCTDEMADECARTLNDNPPKIVIWDKMSDSEWDLLETVFRNGERSGQRELLKFHDEIVEDKYNLMYELDNNRGGAVEVWVLNEK